MDLNGELLCPTLFRGNMEECWRMFAEQVRGGDEYKLNTQRGRKAVSLIAGFCDISTDGARRWFSASNVAPRGITKFYAAAFLELQGYQVIDFERFSLWVQYAYKLIGFKVVSLDELIARVGFSNKDHFSNACAAPPTGRNQLATFKQEIVKILWLERQSQFRRKRRELYAEYALFPIAELAVEAESYDSTSTATLPTADKPEKREDNYLYHLMQGLSILLDAEPSLVTWSDEVKTVAEKVADQLVSRLPAPKKEGEDRANTGVE